MPTGIRRFASGYGEVDLRTITNFMGHSTIQMTMRHSQLSPNQKQDAVSRLMAFKTKRPPERPPAEVFL